LHTLSPSSPAASTRSRLLRKKPPPDQAAELAKKLQNPIASLISFPLQSNFDFRIGPSDEGWRYTLNIQPVIPISIASDWNLIVRTIIPYIHQEDVFKGRARIFEEDIYGVPVEVTRGPRPLGHVQDGLGDTIQSFFFSPKEPVAGWILAAGPVFLYPSATDPLLDYTKIIPEANIELSASPGIAGIRKTGSSKRNPFCTIRTARTNRHSAMLWNVGLKSYIRARCRQPHSSCYMRPRNDDEPKLEKL